MAAQKAFTEATGLNITKLDELNYPTAPESISNMHPTWCLQQGPNLN